MAFIPAQWIINEYHSHIIQSQYVTLKEICDLSGIMFICFLQSGKM